jgi:hypothetical protein
MIELEIPNPIASAKVVSADTPNEVYLNWPTGKRGERNYVISRGQLVEFAKNPLRWRLGYKDDSETKATGWGSLIDCLLLQPDQFEKRYAVCPKTYPGKDGEKEWNWNANHCKEWREAQTGKEVVKLDTHDQACEAVEFMLADEQVKRLVKQSKHQVLVTAVYKDKETGIEVPIKTLLDLVPDLDGEFPKSLFDIKTSMSAHPRAWTKHVHEYGLHVQGALYTDCYTVATGEDRQDFRHIIQESFWPWVFVKRYLSSEFLTIGRFKYLNALKQYCRCLDEDCWPNYESPRSSLILPDGFESINPEAWMID